MYLIFKVVDYLIDPFVGGTSAADPDSLSVKHTFALNILYLFLNLSFYILQFYILPYVL